MLNNLFLAVGILSVIAECSLLIAWVSAGFRYKQTTSRYTPKTCVIVPCKGVQKHFSENVKALCSQDFKNYKVIFVVDSKKDFAYSKLNKLFSKNTQVSIVVSKFIKGCSGKISALINGIKQAGEVEVYVFADSDIKPHKNWLSILVSNLDAKGVGATTGYRWFFPYNFKSLFVSCWNMAQSVSLFYSNYNFAWGGSTAIKKSLFEKLEIQKQWKKGFSDDLILTKTVKSAGYTILFLPGCISESPVDENIIGLIKWGTKQLTWVRWYYPSVWFISVMGAVGLKIVTVFGFIILIFGYTIPGLLMVSTFFFEFISGVLAHRIFRNHTQYSKNRFGSSLAYGLISPIVFFVLAYNNFFSIFKTQIKWGGRVYKKPKKT